MGELELLWQPDRCRDRAHQFISQVVVRECSDDNPVEVVWGFVGMPELNEVPFADVAEQPLLQPLDCLEVGLLVLWHDGGEQPLDVVVAPHFRGEVSEQLAADVRHRVALVLSKSSPRHLKTGSPSGSVCLLSVRSGVPRS